MRSGKRISRGRRRGRSEDSLPALRQLKSKPTIVRKQFFSAWLTYRLTTWEDLLRQGGALCHSSLLNRRSLPKMKTEFLAVERLTLTIITDNYYDALRPDPPIGKRFRAFPGASIHAEHGLSCHLETVLNGKSYSFMFDYGLDPPGIMNDIALLGIRVGSVAALGLSHGHFDHFGGLLAILERARPGTPLYVGEEAFAHRYSRRPGSNDLIDLGCLGKEAIERLNRAEIVEVREFIDVIPGCYLTGAIERVTDYEQGSLDLIIKRNDTFERDYFPGEQAVVCNVKGKGLVVLSGCAHAGIVNTVKHAQTISGIEKVHAVIGGFHLVNAAPEIIESTVSDIKALAPDYVIPAHCTGFDAIVHMAHVLPGQLILNSAGTQYNFTV
jgi:7,8-dihydropterin-6-yl-methyl-4-(beta-D-ribofuranosyl)aminobenzene 5'-phosphate synthase